MTDDEAFIRAIVDSPGDDTPRLVYADWLGDRDDPRGPYLRAELAWAKSGKGEKKLRALAGLLNAVWVARVTRPPLGVCLNCALFANTGTCLTAQQIDVAGGRLSFLPDEYRAFLLNYNGGELTQSAGDGEWSLDAFASLDISGHVEYPDDDSLLTVQQLDNVFTHPNGSDPLFHGSVPIGYTRAEFDSCHFIFLTPPTRKKSGFALVNFYQNPGSREWGEADLDALAEDELEEDFGGSVDDRRDAAWNSMDVEEYRTPVAKSLGAFLAMLGD